MKKVLRTYAKEKFDNQSKENKNELENLLNNGWNILMCHQVGSDLEYVLEKNNKRNDPKRDLAIKLFRKQWSWIASEIRYEEKSCDIKKLEKEFCRTNHFRNIYLNNFLCEYTRGRGSKSIDCEKCPIKWGDCEFEHVFMCESTETGVINEMGLYGRCRYTTNWREQARLAEQIAELPEREDV